MKFSKWEEEAKTLRRKKKGLSQLLWYINVNFEERKYFMSVIAIDLKAFFECMINLHTIKSNV